MKYYVFCTQLMVLCCVKSAVKRKVSMLTHIFARICLIADAHSLVVVLLLLLLPSTQLLTFTMIMLMMVMPEKEMLYCCCCRKNIVTAVAIVMHATAL